MRDYDRFGAEILKNNGFNVSLWDLSNFIYPGSVSAIKNKFGITNHENIIRFNSIEKVVQAIREENHETFFITIIYFDLQTYKIFRAISNIGCKYGVTGAYSVGHYPETENLPFHKRVLKSVYNKTIFKKIGEKVIQNFFKISPNLLGIDCADYYALSGGKLASASGLLIGNNTFIQHIHAYDYDLFLKHNYLINKKQDHEFIVFIDQAFSYHPDAGLFNKSKIDARKYYEDLRRFFDLVESITRLNVVIAAHPKVDYKGRESLFNGRKIVSGHNSLEIISESKSVIMHYSTAVNMAILFRKPILFITTNMLEATYRARSIAGLTKCFNTSPLNINDVNDKIEFPSVNNELYDAYIANYIKKPGTKDELFWQQVANHIKENY